MKSLALLLVLISVPAAAQNAMPVISLPASGPGGGGTAVTVGAASAQAVAAATGPRKLVAIDNESTTATIACNFGGTAALNTAGSWTIPPGNTRTWAGPFVPTDAINCIASAGGTPATFQVN